MAKLYAYPTDFEWFQFLSKKGFDEINFWQPGGSGVFRAIQPGELFLFKLKSPVNKIGGGGWLSTSSRCELSLAWEAFEQRNGVVGHAEMRAAIRRYRDANDRAFDPTIGCIVLKDPFFFEETDWIELPSPWPPGLMKGRSYELESVEGRQLFDAVSRKLPLLTVAEPTEDAEPAMYGAPTLSRQRLGQGGFRLLVTETYQRRCALTGEKALPVLEAAHIKPVHRGGVHRVDNGLLLRSDLHRLYDRGYLTVTPDFHVEVSRRLKDDYDNGEPYYPLHGQRIWLPSTLASQPSSALLQWHADEVFVP